MWDPYAEIEKKTLPNGLTVYAAQWPNRPWEAVGFHVHSGAEHDLLNLEGTAHFVEHLVSENSALTSQGIKDLFEGWGGDVSLGATYFPATQYSFFSPIDTPRIQEALDIFGHLLLNTRLEQQIERERQVIIGEFNQRFPYQLDFALKVAEHKALFGQAWPARMIAPIGSPESIHRITKNDLQTYYDTHYTPANISMCGVGGLNVNELCELLSNSPMSQHKIGERTQFSVAVPVINLPTTSRQEVCMSDIISVPMSAGQFHSSAVLPGSVDKRALTLFCHMAEHILNHEIRQKRGWNYQTSISFQHFGNLFALTVKCYSLPVSALEEIETVIESSLTSMATRQDLFERIRSRQVAGNSLIDISGQRMCDNALDDLMYGSHIFSLAEKIEQYQRITMQDILEILRLFASHRRRSVIWRP